MTMIREQQFEHLRGQICGKTVGAESPCHFAVVADIPESNVTEIISLYTKFEKESRNHILKFPEIKEKLESNGHHL